MTEHDHADQHLCPTCQQVIPRAPKVLFISSPIDDPDNQDREWLD